MNEMTTAELNQYLENIARNSDQLTKQRHLRKRYRASSKGTPLFGAGAEAPDAGAKYP